MQPLTKIFIMKAFLGSLVLFFISLFFATSASAADYVSLINIPGLTEKNSIPGFVNAVYKITIGIGALLGVIKIALAGVKYSMSGVITDKESAKKDIMGVLLGLAILLMPWIVLNTIYPGLLDLNFAEKLNEIAPPLGVEEEEGDDNQPPNVPPGSVTAERTCDTTDSPEVCKKRCRGAMEENSTELSNTVTWDADADGKGKCFIVYKEPISLSETLVCNESAAGEDGWFEGENTPCENWCEETYTTNSRSNPAFIEVTDVDVYNQGGGKWCRITYDTKAN